MYDVKARKLLAEKKTLKLFCFSMFTNKEKVLPFHSSQKKDSSINSTKYFENAATKFPLSLPLFFMLSYS